LFHRPADFFRSTKEKSEGIADVRGFEHVVSMKNGEIRNICSGGEKTFGKIFQKFSEVDF